MKCTTFVVWILLSLSIIESQDIDTEDLRVDKRSNISSVRPDVDDDILELKALVNSIKRHKFDDDTINIIRAIYLKWRNASRHIHGFDDYVGRSKKKRKRKKKKKINPSQESSTHNPDTSTEHKMLCKYRLLSEIMRFNSSYSSILALF